MRDFYRWLYDVAILFYVVGVVICFGYVLAMLLVLFLEFIK